MSAEARHVHNHHVLALEPGCKERKKLEALINLGHHAYAVAENAALRLAQLGREHPTKLDVLLGRVSEGIGIDFDALDRALADVDKLAAEIGEHGTFEMRGDSSNTPAGLREHVRGAVEACAPLRRALGLRK